MPAGSKSTIVDAGLVLMLALAVLLLVSSMVRSKGSLREIVESQAAERSERIRVQNIWQELTESHLRLDEGAGPVELVVFADLQCPFCQQVHAAIDSVMRVYPQMGVVYRYLPMQQHRHAWVAARAATCSAAEGHFRHMYRRLIESEDWQSDTADWAAVAVDVGFQDARSFSECLGWDSTDQLIRRDMALAKRLNVTAVPTFVAKWSVATGTLSFDALADLVRRQR